MLETITATRIIYDDAHIRVIWQPGSSDFALVTFGDLLTLVDGKTFFADKPAAKAGLNCVGVVATAGNFFPKASMQAAAPAILAVIGGFAERVLYGGSMGGYGAIKHSGLLGATSVVALCPQWSIDPRECEGHFPGWPHLLTPALAGMGVRPAEISGAVFVFSDMFDAVDRFQAGMISRADPKSVIINVPMVAHHVTGVFAGTRNLLRLIDGCRRRDVAALLGLTREVRRDHRRRLTGLIEAGIGRHPELVYDIMAERPSPDPSIGPLGAQHLFRAVRRLAGKGRRAAAMSYLSTYRYELRDPAEIILAAAMHGHLAGRDLDLTTHHNTVLVYDIGRRHCVHVRQANDSLHAPVRLQLAGTGVAFFVMLGGARFDLGVNAEARLTSQTDGAPTEDWARFELGARYNGANSFAHAGRYLSAEPDGEVKCDRDTAYEWEHFRLR